jgi:hypothetical protein
MLTKWESHNKLTYHEFITKNLATKTLNFTPLTYVDGLFHRDELPMILLVEGLNRGSYSLSDKPVYGREEGRS